MGINIIRVTRTVLVVKIVWTNDCEGNRERQPEECIQRYDRPQASLSVKGRPHAPKASKQPFDKERILLNNKVGFFRDPNPVPVCTLPRYAADRVLVPGRITS